MRILIIEEPIGPADLAANLARNARTVEATLERVKALNPQIADAKKLPAGTVLILPESSDLKPDAGEPAGASAVAELGARLRAGLRDVASRTSGHSERLTADHAALRNALKTKAAKRLVESDPQLKEQLGAAEARFKAEQKRAAESRAQHEEAQKSAMATLDRLQQLLR